MALTEQEKALGRQIKAQNGTKEDFREALTEFRNRQATPTKPTTATQLETLEGRQEAFPSVETEGVGSVSPDELTTEGQQTLEGVFSQAKERRLDESANISGLDIGVKAGREIGEIAEELKTATPEGEGIIKNTKTAIANIIPDTAEVVGETIELISDPVGTVKGAHELAQGISDKLVFGTLNKIFGKDVVSNRTEVVDAVAKDMVDTYGSVDKFQNQVVQNPVDTATFIIGALKTGAKVARNAKNITTSQQAQLNKALEEAEKNINQFVDPTTKKNKQLLQKITPEFIQKLKTGELTPADRQVLAEFTSKQKDFLGQQIDEALEAGLQGTVSRSDLLEVLDDLQQRGTVDGVIIDESIVTATDKMADTLSAFPEEIPADKARELRKMFDDTVFKSKGPTTEEALAIKNVIKKKLADNIRGQLATQNPTLADINKEFSFYANLDDLLEETILRKGPQGKGGGLETKASTLRTQIGSSVGSALGALSGTDAGRAAGSAAGFLAGGKLDTYLSSPKRALVDAKKQAELADAIANGDPKAFNKALNDIMAIIGVSEQLEDNEE